jgi:hypothetical protein
VSNSISALHGSIADRPEPYPQGPRTERIRGPCALSIGREPLVYTTGFDNFLDSHFGSLHKIANGRFLTINVERYKFFLDGYQFFGSKLGRLLVHDPTDFFADVMHGYWKLILKIYI